MSGVQPVFAAKERFRSDLTEAIPYVITIIMMVYVVVSGQRRRERLAKKQLKMLETK